MHTHTNRDMRSFFIFVFFFVHIRLYCVDSLLWWYHVLGSTKTFAKRFSKRTSTHIHTVTCKTHFSSSSAISLDLCYCVIFLKELPNDWNVFFPILNWLKRNTSISSIYHGLAFSEYLYKNEAKFISTTNWWIG